MDHWKMCFLLKKKELSIAMLVYQRVKCTVILKGFVPSKHRLDRLAWCGHTILPLVEWFLFWNDPMRGSVSCDVLFMLYDSQCEKKRTSKNTILLHILVVCCVPVFFFMHVQNKRWDDPQNRRGSRWLTPTQKTLLCANLRHSLIISRYVQFS